MEHVSAAKYPRDLRPILHPSAPTTASRGALVAVDAMAADAAIAEAIAAEGADRLVSHVDLDKGHGA